MRTHSLLLRRGNTLPIAVGGVLFLAFLTTLLSRFSAAERPASRPRTLYLDDASGAISRQRAKRKASEVSSREKVEAARRKARNQRTLAFRHASSGLLFRGPGHGEPAQAADLHALLTSTDVLHRLFGGPDGDFIYHRQHGWMRFTNGQWSRVRDDELPQSVQSAYPALVGRNAGGGDSSFQAAPWMGGAEEEEEG